MAPTGEATLPPTRRIRKSLGLQSDPRKSADKENATVDLGSTAASKKSRSKSLGPGGLDALKQGSGNRRASLAAPPKPPRSILKPTVAALPEIPPLKKKSNGNESRKSISGARQDDSSGSKIALRTEEEQQAAAREREERERRDARRKSLANRRVSFAAEATLHTFHEVEFPQDSTTSTDSTRRASTARNSTNAYEDESTAQAQQYVAPNNQVNSQQSNRRRSSGISAASFGTRDDDTATSTIYSSDSEPADVVEELVTEDEADSNSDSDDGTMMTVVTDELTGTSVGTDRSDDSNDSDDPGDSDGQSSTLDEALRLAAHRAGTQNFGEDGEEVEDDSEAEEIIPSFGWIKKPIQTTNTNTSAATTAAPRDDPTLRSEDGTNMDMDMDMEVTGALGGIITSNAVESSPIKDGDEDMSMEVTRAIGGILGQSQPLQSGASDDEQEENSMDEGTMDLTTAIGGIRASQNNTSAFDSDGNEDMSMELTTIMGGVLGKQKRQSIGPNRRRTVKHNQGEGDDATMDMTTGIGKIVIESDPHGDDDNDDDDSESTFGMDMTTAIGGIINKQSNINENDNTSSRMTSGQTSDRGSPAKHTVATPSRSSPRRRSSPRKNPEPQTSEENDDPGLWAFQGNGLRRSVGRPLSAAQQITPDSRTPSPGKPATPRVTRSSPNKPASQTQQRTTRSASRSASKPASPDKPRSSPRKTKTPSPAKGTKRKFLALDNNAIAESSPLVLTPQRTLSGLGADRSGLGSPRVAALFDRRESLGDAADDFVPGKRLVSFEDPKELSEEIDREREAASALEDKEATFNLKEMIESLSPKRKPLLGRKSLHVGSAAGLLGKRPAELSEDEDDAEEQDGVKRLKGHQGSPVKNVKLQQPPSRSDFTGSLLKSSQQLFGTPGGAESSKHSSPQKNGQGGFSKPQTRFVVDDPTTRDLDLEQSPTKTVAELEDAEDGRIHLRNFLNMTSIRFMELTTTKRRHTAAPSSFRDTTSTEEEDDTSLERCVVAGASTVPTLELYQHSCRELKKYISEGRRIIKEIESDTFEENPPIFREYLTAQPDVKALMDNQFKNVKTHARLLSKAMWYEWRMKLQDGLKEGLLKISEGMDSDDKLLQKQQDLLKSVLPDLVSKHEALVEQSENLEEVARELAESDPDELEAAREELTSIDSDIAAKKKLIAELHQQYEDAETTVQDLSSQKEQCLSDIRESERIREECRGWTSAEINAFKDRVDAIERQQGWAVTGISGTTLSMTYMREVELVFDISSFQPGQPSSRLDLWYIGDDKNEGSSSPKTAEKEIFLQCIRDHIRGLPQSETPVSELLRAVRDGWDKARLLTKQIQRINITFPTTTTRTSDSSVAITSSLMLVALETRVEVTLNLHGQSGSDGVEFSITPEAIVVYGEHFNVAKVSEFLSTRMGSTIGATEEEWSDIVVELKEKLILRGRKK